MSDALHWCFINDFIITDEKFFICEFFLFYEFQFIDVLFSFTRCLIIHRFLKWILTIKEILLFRSTFFFFFQRERMFNHSRDCWKLYLKREKRWFFSWTNEALIFSLYANDSSSFDKVIVTQMQRRWRDNCENHALTFVNLIFWWRVCEFCFIDEFNAFIDRYSFIHCFLKWILIIKKLFSSQFNSFFFFLQRWRMFNCQRWKKRDC